MDQVREYPFAAIVGQEDAKLAIILHLIHPGLNGVLLSGESGIGKTALLRGASQLLVDLPWVELPLGITEDRLYGGIDLEEAMVRGAISFKPGLLAEADGGCLLLDNIHLMDDQVVRAATFTAETGYLQIEREGGSYIINSEFCLFAAMNPDEGHAQPALLNRIGLFVHMEQVKNRTNRGEIIRRRLSFENHAECFEQAYMRQTEELRRRLIAARLMLPQVLADVAILKLAARLVSNQGFVGHRADLHIVEAARAHAAWEGREVVLEDDLVRVADFMINRGSIRQDDDHMTEREHRSETEGVDGDTDADQSVDLDATDTLPTNGESSDLESGAYKDLETEYGSAGESGAYMNDRLLGERSGGSVAHENVKDTISVIGRSAATNRILTDMRDEFVRKNPRGYMDGRRGKSRTAGNSGRLIGARLPKGVVKAPAFGATLRAAAPYQRFREKHGMAITIEPEDIRESIRERDSGSALLFVVDGSGSMAVKRRMEVVKGAIFDLLQDAYHKRDRVGMVLFRKDRAESVLPLTRSVKRANDQLLSLPTGGGTPLAHGLQLGAQMLSQAQRQYPGITTIMIVVTDGKANVGLPSTDSSTGVGQAFIKEQLQSVARMIREQLIQTIVIDSEQGFVRLGLAKQLADSMGAVYGSLDECDGRQLAHSVRRYTEML